LRMSNALIPTVKETPADAEIVSHKLMIRAGLMRKLGSGIYTYLPMGLKVIRKVEQIVREEMNRAGAQELLMPILSPSELWLESGRWNVYGKELMRIKDRHSREFALGPTHEEVITDIARKNIKSYRELPVNLYQIQTKFRDEIRPRFGVMRAREFIMKDAYSFHSSKKCMRETYKIMFDTYTRIFKRCGLRFKPVLADSGAIGGDMTHEFTVLAESGETLVFFCEDDKCGYAASSDSAAGKIERKDTLTLDKNADIEKVHTPNMKTVEEVSEFFNEKKSSLIKTLLYKIDDQIIAVLVRGDREVNEAKLQSFFKNPFIELADEESVKRVTKAEVGFAGPVNLDVPVYADLSVKQVSVAISGANETDYHFKNIVPDRDFKIEKYIDVSLAQKGDACPKCGKKLDECRGIEVGQVFQLGTKYSTALNAVYHDRNGKEMPYLMGCYGIGITRTLAAAIEQSYDDNGIIWPYSLAPYHITVLMLNQHDEEIKNESESIYEELTKAGFDVLLDDRDERPGFKFKDADLLGIPIRIVVGKSFKKDKVIEVKKRDGNNILKVGRDGLTATIKNIIDELDNKING